VAEDRAVSRAATTPKAGREARGIRVGSASPVPSSALDEGYRGPQVCQLVGISYRQLDYWARTGLLRPSVAEAKGSGTKRRYSYRDLLELKVIKKLLDAGVSLQSARRAVGCLREELGADLAASNLVLSDTTTVLAHSDGELVDLLAGGQGVFNVVPLSGVVNELAADIVRIERPTPGEAAPRDRPARAAGE
jgi:DNA-binding transcriptional MerR regulator